MIESLFWLTTCIYFEARGEPVRGQVAVAHVILNRAEKRGKSVKEIILQPYQFSWANKGGRPPIQDYNAFIKCMKSAKSALIQRMNGKTLDHCDHYHATWIEPPSWASEMQQVHTIGQHIFYRS